MTTALIGHTGFVGGNLLRQTQFDALFNSTNIRAIEGQSYDLLVCSGARAEKWKAAQDPVADWQNVASLIEVLGTVRAKTAVLISTIDVYPAPRGVDESTTIDGESNHPYGKHRYRLEDFFRSRFDTLVLRLPGLFGHGLKKNVIYDFLNDNDVSKVNSDGVFQFYNLDWLWNDVEKARASGIALLNLATEPVSVRDLAQEAFGTTFDNPLPNPALYDFRSLHFPQWGGRDGYLRTRDEVMIGMRDFVAASRHGTDR